MVLLYVWYVTVLMSATLAGVVDARRRAARGGARAAQESRDAAGSAAQDAHRSGAGGTDQGAGDAPGAVSSRHADHLKRPHIQSVSLQVV